MIEGIFNTTLVFLVLGCLIVLLLSFAAMVIFEGVSDTLKWRSKFLKEVITEMLDDPDLTRVVYEHPLVANLYQFGRKSSLPNYIPAKKFSMAVFDIISNRGPETRDEMPIAKFARGVKQLPNSGLKATLEALLENARAKSEPEPPSMNTILLEIQEWFDDSMDALSRYYQQRTRLAYYMIGLTLAFFLNIDSGKILSSLWYQATFPQRQAILEQTVTYLGNNSSSGKDLQTTISRELQSNLSILDFPIGWQFLPFDTFGRQCSLVPSDISQVWGIPSRDSLGMPICKRLVNVPADLFGWIGKLAGMFATGAFIPVGSNILFNSMKKLTSRGSIVAQPIE